MGHQGLACLHGGKIAHAPKVAHGVVSKVSHDEDPLFKGIPSPFDAVRYYVETLPSDSCRYHSWIVVEPLGDQLQRIASTTDDKYVSIGLYLCTSLIMAIKHKEKPFWGVQFHPESVGTTFGKNILKNFHDITIQLQKNLKEFQYDLQILEMTQKSSPLPHSSR